MNPILKENCFVPDVEAREMPDGRLYLYGSWDLSGDQEYCSKELHCFSTDDMVNFVDHGVIFRNDDRFAGIPWQKGQPLYAPDCIYKDGRYYLYVCGPDDDWGYEGVAVGESPIGPFLPAEKMGIADGDGIDPAVFVDDDGQAYYFWGQFSLRGCKLAEDMKTMIPESITYGIITEWEHGFHEGASIRKRGDKYYMVYTDISGGKATAMSYAMADHPFGPYKKGGIIVDNMYCDPQSWNNHGSIACYKGEWYVFYHRSSQNSFTSRRVCVEKITFDEEGKIAQVEQTSQGAAEPFDAYREIRGSWACRSLGEGYIAPADGREMLVQCGMGPFGKPGWAEFKYIDFGTDVPDCVTVVGKGHGRILLRIEGDQKIGEGQMNLDDMGEVVFPVQPISGVHPVWMFFEGENFTIDSFIFGKGNK